MERVISRTELRADSPEQNLEPDDIALQRLIALTRCDFATETPIANGVGPPDVQKSVPDGLEFRLFAKPSLQFTTAASQPTQRVRVRSPSADPTTAGLVQPEGPRARYFTISPNDEARRRLNSAAVTSSQVQEFANSLWPGSTYEWKVQHINVHGYPISAMPTVQTSSLKATVVKSTKHCKFSKAARIRQRVRLGKLRAARDAAENAGAAEREKKSARNREKKLKKKAREKAKKVAGGLANADDGEAISSTDGDDG
nr:hypothetical protein B0A51_02038 [Rachicladosporium sp. CCFEE 5018]